MRAKNKRYRAANREELLVADRERYWADPEAARASARGRYYADVEASRARARLYAELHRAEAITRARLWILAHPGKVNEYAYTRARRVQAAFVEEVTVADLAARDGDECWLCRKPVDLTLKWTVTEDLAPTVDHVVPVSEGGKHALANARLAHWACNRGRRRRFSAQEIAYLLDLTAGYTEAPRRQLSLELEELGDAESDGGERAG